jgi:anti-sigma factor RsiW
LYHLYSGKVRHRLANGALDRSLDEEFPRRGRRNLRRMRGRKVAPLAFRRKKK